MESLAAEFQKYDCHQIANPLHQDTVMYHPMLLIVGTLALDDTQYS